MYIDREQISSRFSGDVEGEQRNDKRGRLQTGTRKLLQMMNMHIILIVVMFLGYVWMFFVCLFAVCKLYFNKILSKKKKKKKKVILGIYPFATRM